MVGKKQILIGIVGIGILAGLLYPVGKNAYETYSQNQIAQEAETYYPFNEAIWYRFYHTEVNARYYELADDTKGFKTRWYYLGKKYLALKDNPNVKEEWLDYLYIQGWKLEREEDRPPIMSLLRQAQEISNEVAHAKWQLPLRDEEVATVEEWLADHKK